VNLKVVLALLQAGILAAGLALLGTLVVESFERSLRSDADDLLAARADLVEASVRAWVKVTGDAGGVRYVEPDPPELDAFAAPGLFFEVWTEDGQRVSASPGMPPNGLPWSAEARAALARREPLLESAPTGTGPRVRILTRPILEDGNLIAVVRAGESLQPIDLGVNDLLRSLFVGSLLILVASIGVTWLVVSRTLEPLESIARTAELIAATGNVSLAVRPAGTAEVRQLATSFNRMVERLRALLDTQRQLLADTSHELRNPLTVIRTDLDLLGRDLDTETRQEVATEASEEAERMSRLVADLLYLSREEHIGRGADELVALDVLAADVVERLRQVAPDHEVRIGRHEAVTVLGHADRLHQLVTNLIENAIRYTPSGGHVRVDVGRAADGLVQLDVTDDGIGITPEHLPRVWDRFYRVDPARARATGGTGLGLAIVKHVAEAHGGTVSAQSVAGSGSTFSVVLPAGPADASYPGDAPTPSGRLPTLPGQDSPATRAATPSVRAADSPPVGTPPTPGRPAPDP
jgi:signal transduction histidine kinase